MPQTLLPFASDYECGAHPAILDALAQYSMEPNAGYGEDIHTQAACQLIREACDAPSAEIHLLSGGTQTNAVALSALMMPWQGVLCAVSGHINVHEAGAIEADGHKVMELNAEDGKISAHDVERAAVAWEKDPSREHMVMPGAVYISQPTEIGTLYTLRELKALSCVCKAHALKLYVDGARLAYALAAPQNDVTLPDLARLTDAFYLGGTKCGALLGEALVFPQPNTCPHFFTLIKRHGALLAKGMLLGIQFETLMKDGLYQRIGEKADKMAARIAQAAAQKGILASKPATNQIFLSVTDEQLAALETAAEVSVWEAPVGEKITLRLACSWSTQESDVDELIAQIEAL
ncbi:MAG: threonine aldolase family protein [Atopobiaceae bacterium]|jgi:threonine aldolase